jgi:hypothetical protein
MVVETSCRRLIKQGYASGSRCKLATRTNVHGSPHQRRTFCWHLGLDKPKAEGRGQSPGSPGLQAIVPGSWVSTRPRGHGKRPQCMKFPRPTLPTARQTSHHARLSANVASLSPRHDGLCKDADTKMRHRPECLACQGGILIRDTADAHGTEDRNGLRAFDLSTRRVVSASSTLTPPYHIAVCCSTI